MTDGTECWLPVVGYEGYYEVSDRGRVRSLDRWVEGPNRWGATSRYYRLGQMLKPVTLPAGYRFVGLSRAGHVRRRAIHTLVLQAFVGPRLDGTEACHGNGNPADNNLINLRWDTRRENILDAVRHGTNHNASQTHCPRGHGLTAPNLTPNIARAGNRGCYACSLTHPWGKTRGLTPVDPEWQTEADRRYAEILYVGHPIRYSNSGRSNRWTPGSAE